MGQILSTSILIIPPIILMLIKLEDTSNYQKTCNAGKICQDLKQWAWEKCKSH